MFEIVTKSARQTQRVARMLAGQLSGFRPAGAAVIALHGELGTGKTTFAQGFARALDVRENVLSPTFVLMKIYALKKKSFRHLVHVDCYRLASPPDLLHLGFKETLKDKDAIILIEWADRIKKILPRDAIWITFAHGLKQNERRIMFDAQELAEKL